MGSSGSKGKRDCTLDSRATREFRRRIGTPPHRIREIGRKAWKEEVGYPMRWRIEGAFSDLKRRFGDIMRARRRENMAADLYWRLVDYNEYKGIRSALA